MTLAFVRPVGYNKDNTDRADAGCTRQYPHPALPIGNQEETP